MFFVMSDIRPSMSGVMSYVRLIILGVMSGVMSDDIPDVLCDDISNIRCDSDFMSVTMAMPYKFHVQSM